MRKRTGFRAATDVEIALRRYRGPIGVVEYRRRTDFSETPLPRFLEVAQELPDRCARHGRAAVEHIDTQLRLHQGARGQVESTWWSSYRWSLTRYRETPTTTVHVHGRWPLCRSCARLRRVLTALAYCLGLAGPIALCVFFLAAQAGVVRSVSLPVVFAFFPGWLPCALALALTLYTRGRRPARVRPMTSTANIIVRAHPDFAAALGAGQPTPPR
ncbi:hypothetical protein [Nocardia grenadensis]|uniref:hypothetical protein n=1 Tax=Nocardia grenadensis TaxID=931537 RepID=UPI0007A46CFA|nr:hypothetical protein [Nocardia grenadensis]